MMNPNTDYLVRSATAYDEQGIIALDQHSNPHPWSVALIKDALQARHNWVIEVASNSDIVGWLTASQVADQAELEQIVTHLDHRRKGLGKSLMQTWLDWCDAHSMYECLLEVRESNIAAITLYQQLGFDIVGRRKNYYALASGGTESAILMTRPSNEQDMNERGK